MSKDSKIPDLENIPNEGLLRVKQLLRFIPVSRSHWWQGVKEGRYPQPLKLSERITVWRASDIRALFDSAAKNERIGHKAA